MLFINDCFTKIEAMYKMCLREVSALWEINPQTSNSYNKVLKFIQDMPRDYTLTA